MKMKIALVLIFVVCQLSGCANQSATLYPGEVEAPLVSQITEVSGKILESPIELGQSVAVGQVLAVLDNEDAVYAYEQMEQAVIKKQAALAQLEEEPEAEAIQLGENNIVIAQQQLENAKLLQKEAQAHYEKQTILFEHGALAEELLTEEKNQLVILNSGVITAKAQLANAEAQLALTMKNKATAESVRFAKADLAQVESQLAELKDDLVKYTIVSANEGVVVSKNYSHGDLAMAGSPLVELSLSSEKYLVVYLPVALLNQVNYGQSVTIAHGEIRETGIISYLDLKSQYTPKDQQSKSNKNKETIKIKIRLTPDTTLRPGEAADLVWAEREETVKGEN